ncbi:hypothetical protein J6590_067681 [Homalodisca vitripennis]|nr:hypothetical protein J6590_067681 [Homalodisca vitripennis]
MFRNNVTDASQHSNKLTSSLQVRMAFSCYDNQFWIGKGRPRTMNGAQSLSEVLSTFYHILSAVLRTIVHDKNKNFDCDIYRNTREASFSPRDVCIISHIKRALVGNTEAAAEVSLLYIKTLHDNPSVAEG